MNETPDILDFQGYLEFLESADILRRYISALSYEEAKALWKCNDKIAEQNFERFRYMDLRKNLTPALIAYEGIQYQYMAPAVLEAEAVAYLQAHLRILSGFYGMLKPLDGVVPYRLEMQAKASVKGCKISMSSGDTPPPARFSVNQKRLSIWPPKSTVKVFRPG